MENKSFSVGKKSDPIAEWFTAHETFWTSALALYLEVTVIRLHSSYFQLFSYFKNISLLSCFLGLGMGFARLRRKSFDKSLIFPLFALQALLLHGLSATRLADVLQNPLPENLAFGLFTGHGVESTLGSVAFLAIFFLLNAVCFLPLGEWISESMDGLPKTQAYEANLLGSLMGIAAFTLLSLLEVPPVAWLIIPALLTLALRFRDPRMILSSSISIALLAIVLSVPIHWESTDYYSPYQIVSLLNSPNERPQLQVSHAYHQKILDLRPEVTAHDPEQAQFAEHYNLPYRVRPNAKRVLVMGSGTGNDVAAALRNGAEHVDAVEIDPVILRLGETLHPERPYQSERVTEYLTDGRSFLRSSKTHYDLIVFGLIDSHALLSGLSSVRLDSYIYTVDAFRELKTKLNPGGAACLSFCLIHPAIGKKLFLMLKEAFDGKSPRAYLTNYDQGVAFIERNEASDQSPPVTSSTIIDISDKLEAFPANVSLSTDDWPFLYMITKKYPVSFLVTLGLMMIISLGFVYRLGLASREHFSGFFFCMGAGFMLVETSAITRLALQFGNTWFVVSLVIAGVLVLAFLANRCVMQYRPLPVMIIYGLLFASLFLSYAISASFIQSLPISRGIALLQLLPVFFSGLLFSAELNRAKSIGYALGSNVLGAMVGGFLEYNAMVFGFRALILHAILVYLGALLLNVREGKSTSAT